ncbi:multidrug effflux MFS transporter [Arenibaculum sp.]|uniref:multidrug effflux MFS transporter n=1 Tax=Arenibaculum sp. TaxID=2865862 RepID=UPI002E0EB80E|nr:multidrug effflux MFS transporter [Arenibaculum sp.]
MPRPQSRTVAVLLTALVAFGPLSTDLYLPSLPLLASVFSTDAASVQLTLSVFLVGFAVSQLVYGPMSDRFGRRPVILGGVAIFVVASVACTFAQSIEQLVAARFFQAVGACCGPVLGRAVVRDVYGRDGAARILAYMAMAVALGPAVGPVIGGVLTTAFGWRANFVLLLAFGAVILVAAALLLDETNDHLDPLALRPGRLASNYATLLGDRVYIGYVLCASFVYSGIFAFISGSSFVLIDGLGLSPEEYGLSFGVVVVGYITGSFGAGRLSLALGPTRMVALGTAVLMLGGLSGLALAVAGEPSVASILAPLFVFLAGAGLTLPNTMAGAIGPFPAMAGLASALLGFIQMTLASAVGIFVGHLDGGDGVVMMAATAAASVAAAACRRLVAPRPAAA